MADTIDVKNNRLNMGEVMITSRQTQGEIERGEEGLMEVHDHSYGSILITRSYPTEERAYATVTIEKISEQDAAASPSGVPSISPGIDYEANYVYP